MTNRKRHIKTIGFLFLLSISLFIPFIPKDDERISSIPIGDTSILNISAQRSVTSEWLKNNDFATQGAWYWENGTEGDNSDTNAVVSSGQANYEVLGETKSFSVTSGTANASTWYGWGTFNNSDFLLPDATAINASGCYTYHYLDETSGPGQVHNFPSVHFRKNVSLPDDMSDYIITDVSLEVLFNASVDINVDSYNDWNPIANTPQIDWDKFEIGDSANFYTELSDINNSYPFRVANFETRDVALGEGDLTDPDILELTDTELNYVDNQDLIAALNTALEGDQQNFAITLGLDIYCEDNRGSPGDQDEWYYLIFKSVNLTITYVRKIDLATTLSWNQVGNTLDSATTQVTNAEFFFRYKINSTWPVTAPLSEIKFYINGKSFDEGIIKLSSATTSWQDAKGGGFDVTSLILTDVNITVSIEVFIKDTFELGQGIAISIDDVHLNISYIETFPDYGTDLELFLDGEDKTLDPVIQIPIEDMLNVTVTYKDNVSANHISADSATIAGKVSGEFFEISALEQYYFSVNSSELGLGESVLTVTLQKTNYETRTIQILVEVIERETNLHLLIDGVQRANKATINVKFNELLNFTVFYEDNLTNTYINGASVELLGFGGMDESLSQYNFTLNTNNLSQGVNVLTFFAQKSNYESQTIQIYINVVERATQIILEIDDSPTAGGAEIYSQYDKFINITVFYIDLNTSSHIDGSSVELLGVGSMNETLSQYNYTLDTNTLEQGVNVFTIFAQKDNYQSQTIQFLINVQIRKTNVTFSIDGFQRNDGYTLDTQFDISHQVIVQYIDNETGSHLTGADVDFLGLGSFSEIGMQFNYTINTNLLVEGINYLTIFAQLDGYEPQTIRFFINVEERETDLYLFINDIRRYKGDTVQFEANELINVTVFYKDNITDAHLIGANVELLGFGNMNETLNQYNFTLNTNDLERGINILTIFAQLDNYQPETIQFFINVIDRYTELEIYLSYNGMMTTDPFIEIPIGTVVNLTIKFYDHRTGVEIPSALLQLIGITIFENLTESLIYNQYSIILDNLSLGVSQIFTIVAQAPSYQVNTTDIRITVRPIKAAINTLTGVSYADLEPNEDYRIRIVLNNTDFGGTIKNATVTFRWDNGQGTLTDSNNDGIYEATLFNVPARSTPFIITINAYAGENYDFGGEYEIVLTVEPLPGPDITIILISLAAGVVGITTAFILYQKHFKYPAKVRMVRKVRKKINKGKKLKPLTVSSRDSIIAHEVENNREFLSGEKEFVDKINKKQEEIL
ncbi:MAG: hypothetical protein ACFE96_00310 [Candidatus Hermodarchaeota archaeon]